jgi:D-tyrosyl-tRNA(Tyr) deacylase
MKVLLQRVKRAEVNVAGERVSHIGKGLLVFLGIERNDTEDDLAYYADKVLELRIFEDENGKMNLSILDVQGEILLVSQFTLAASTRKGRRPSFTNAASPDKAEDYYHKFKDQLAQSGLTVQTGRFQEMMEVELVNAGPVTLLIDPR